MQQSRRPPNPRGWTGKAKRTVHLRDLQYYHNPPTELPPLTYTSREKRVPPEPVPVAPPVVTVDCGCNTSVVGEDTWCERHSCFAMFARCRLRA